MVATKSILLVKLIRLLLHSVNRRLMIHFIQNVDPNFAHANVFINLHNPNTYLNFLVLIYNPYTCLLKMFISQFEIRDHQPFESSNWYHYSLYSEKVVKILPSKRLKPKPLVPNQRFPSSSSKILRTELLTKPTAVV